MWFWIGLALILSWGGWGYWRRRWWLRAMERSIGEARRGEPLSAAHYQPPPGLILPDRIVTSIAGAAAIIGLFLAIGSYWTWF